MVRRILVDSQNNPLFLGSALEQAYSFRGGLCQGGKGDIVVLPGSIADDYLDYWRAVAQLPMPVIVTLSQNSDVPLTTTRLLLRDKIAQATLRGLINGHEARLEFFCIGEDERELARVLQVPVYADFDVAINLALKSRFKAWWDSLGIKTPAWTAVRVGEPLPDAGLRLVQEGPAVAKLENGTGGLTCGGAVIVHDQFELRTAMDTFAADERFVGSTLVLERLVPNAQTLSVHWRVPAPHRSEYVGTFLQRGEFAYAGVQYPVGVSSRLQGKLVDDVTKMQNSISESVGHFCGDVVVDTRGERYWVDFNPRKGAIIYVFDVACRIADTWKWKASPPAFEHRHLKLDWLRGQGFSVLQSRLGNLLVPRESGFILVTNPGVFPFGYADITGIAATNEAASKILEVALELLQ